MRHLITAFRYALATSALLFAFTLTSHATERQTADSPPVLKAHVLPDYPEIARVLGIHGEVVVECLIDERGRVFGAEVVRSVHAAVDNAALDAVSRWQFTPAMRNGKAVPQVVRIPLKFDLVAPGATGAPLTTVQLLARS
jgi:TonB family protein